MNTAFVLAAVMSTLLGAAPTTPTWNGSYVEAQQQAAGKKPLAVVFGSGQEGWTKLVRSEESKKLLAEQYVCVYVDIANESGKKLAGSFGINGQSGVVLSDRSGAVQAYWHNGDLADANLSRSLRKYADPQTVVATTEREGVQVSYYPPNQGVATGTVINGVFYNGTVVNGVVTSPVRSSCPNGNCPNVR